MPSVVLCVVETCSPIRGAHADDCDTTDCRGCLPRVAEQPLAVCTACRLRFVDRLTEIGIGTVHAASEAAHDADCSEVCEVHKPAGATTPPLYAALLAPTRIPSATRGGAEAPQALGDGALDARANIEQLIRAWVPSWASPAPRADVPTGTAWLLRNAGRLLADRDSADALVRDVDMIWREARRRAYPQPPEGHRIGTCPLVYDEAAGPELAGTACGGQVRAVVEDADAGGWARCLRCRTSAVIRWWLEQMPPDTRPWLTMPDLRWHLMVMDRGRQVPASTIRSWVAHGELPSRRVGADANGEGGRVEYETATAVALALANRGRGRQGRVPTPRPATEDAGARSSA